MYGSSLRHNLTLAQVEHLEQIFAVLTAEGWVIPAWLIELRNGVRHA
jgi:hypothetical protein